MKLLIAATILGLATTTVTAADAPVDLTKAVAVGIELLEDEQYEKFITTYMRPAELKKLLESKTMDELVRKFSKNKANRLVAVLKQTQSLEPEVSESGETATFLIKLPDRAVKKPLVFEKIDKLWRLCN
jgi:hypothetical protein